MADTIKVDKEYYEKLIKTRRAFETLYDKSFGLGPFVMTIQFENDIGDFWVDAKIAPMKDPNNDLAAWCGEADDLEEVIADMAEAMVDPLEGE